MSWRQIVGLSGVFLTSGALSFVLSGCGGGQETNPDGTVKAIPIVNPTPGAMEPEKPIPGK